MSASRRLYILAVTTAVTLLASACSAGAGNASRTTGSAPAVSAAPSGRPTARIAPPPTSTPSAPTPSVTSDSSVTPLDAGLHVAQVMGTGTYPRYTVEVPDGWYDRGGRFTVKYQGPGPVLGLSVWDVGQVFRDPCHWRGQAFDPGPSVDDLVAALVAQRMRNATKPVEVTLAGYAGRYLELSVPADMRSSTWTSFDDCDVQPDGARDFQGWLGNGMGNRYEQVPGQVDRLWVLDVDGQRLLVDATYSPDTTQADRDELQRIVESLRFVAP